MAPQGDSGGEYVVLPGDDSPTTPFARDHDAKLAALGEDADSLAPPPKKSLWNYNVVMTLLLCAVSGMSDSIWAGTVLAAYLYIITDESNKKVGYVEAVQGLATLLTALPVGTLADKYGRGKAAALGGVVTFLAVGATAYAVIDHQLHPSDDDEAYVLLICAMALWGVSSGVISGPLQALYADSIPTGERSRFYLYLSGAWLLSSCVGPMVAIIVFLTRTNDWTTGELRVCIYIGLAGETIVGAMLFLFSDKKALGRESDHITADDSDLKAMLHDAEQAKLNDAERLELQRRHALSQRLVSLIPLLTFVAGLVTAIGSGMTVKFFPLFFKNDCEMTPAGVQTVYLLVPISIVGFSGLGTWVAGKGFGRVQTIMLFKAIGVSALFLMGFLKEFRGRWEVMVPIYLFRTGIMNSTYPLEESILMDYVPKESRARWKSLESIAQFGWCGSAALGGYLADRFGYGYTFIITACVQGSAISIWALLLPAVPRVEAKAANHNTSAGGGVSVNSSPADDTISPLHPADQPAGALLADP